MIVRLPRLAGGNRGFHRWRGERRSRSLQRLMEARAALQTTSLLRKVQDNLWLLGTCRDWRTLRAMKNPRTPLAKDVQALRFRGLGSPLLYRPGTSDVSVAWEVFQRREYDCLRAWDFERVVDCGANVGMFLAFAVMKMGERLRRYVGVEADRDSFGLLELQPAAVAVRSKSLLLQVAAWEHDGEVRFDDRGPSWGRHVSTGTGTRVRAMTIESILDAAGLEECDLLKLDIEGGESTVLPRMKSWGPRVRTVVAELHHGLDYPWFAGIAESAGFEPFPPGKLFRAHPAAIRR
jgi:FkbM family methyltransferase